MKRRSERKLRLGRREEEGRRKKKKKKKKIRVYVPAFHEILEALTPLDTMHRLILQLRDRLPHNVGQQINQPGPGLHLGAIGGEGKAVLGHLQQGDAQRPHVRGDGVGLALDPLRRHVVRGADEGVGIAFGAELAADAKVAQFDLPVAAE
jgi:hypothetical protein